MRLSSQAEWLFYNLLFKLLTVVVHECDVFSSEALETSIIYIYDMQSKLARD